MKIGAHALRELGAPPPIETLAKLPVRDLFWSAGNYVLAGLFLPAFMIWYLGELSIVGFIGASAVAGSCG